MSFLDHLEALRWHLIRSVIVVVALAIVAFVKKTFVFDVLVLGPKNPDFLTYQWLCKLSDKTGIDLCIEEISFVVKNLAMAGSFTMHMWVAIVAGIIVGFPYIAWEIWRFIKPALKSSELKYARGMVFYISILFMIGVLFGYYIISPLSVNFLGGYTVSAEVPNEISLQSYVSTVATLTLMAGVVFELPVFVYFLTKIGLVNPPFLRAYRRHSIVVILIIAALITPSPDIISQIIVAIPLLLLYEVGIYVSKMVVKGQENV
ncbi:MAG: twin-arginine translocase subunit TatC [Bacteroidia bacterium]|nr:twin-arginine translocase subunit TatC [Bacteroidia bacterium]